jgi:AcrR family transcriptional regulator
MYLAERRSTHLVRRVRIADRLVSANPAAILLDVSRGGPAIVGDAAPVVYSRAQMRVVNAALDLFAEHGVGGTSLQMIADAIGVTKAAVYHQFQTKDDIVLAAADAELARVEAALDLADAQSSRVRARQVLVVGIVDLAVEHRSTMSVILGDPVIRRFFADNARFHRVIDRLTDLLVRTGEPSDRRVSTAMFMAAISGAVMHPLVADLGDETLRAQLLLLARRLLNLPA